METPRIEVVERLMNGAFNGMREQAEGSTPAEAYTALMNISLRAMREAKASGQTMEAFRDVVMDLYALLPPGN